MDYGGTRSFFSSHDQALRENCRLGRQLASALEARAAREKRLAASVEYLAESAEGQTVLEIFGRW